MANTILTPNIITREALRILHQKSNFIGSINRQYDDSFAREGAKIGDSLRIRLPNRYTVRNGINLALQDTVETQTTLQVANVKGVDMSFTSQELTLSLDDFSKRIIEPAMAVLAANIEADVLSMTQSVSQLVGDQANNITLKGVLQGRKKLEDSLTPSGNRTALLNTSDNVNLVSSISGLFNDTTTIAKQYREGYMGRTAGFDFMENTLMPTQARSSATGFTATAGSGDGSSITVTGTGVIDVGTVFTVAGVNRVHPETKQDTGELMQFTVVSATGAPNTTLITISPAYVTTGAFKNVTTAPSTGALTLFGTVSTPYQQSLLYHKDAFTFATADLVMPQGVDFAAREVMDGISMSIVRQFQINDRSFPTRIDVLYGYKAIRPELACRLAFKSA